MARSKEVRLNKGYSSSLIMEVNYKVATDIHHFSQSHDGSYFSHGFLPGPHSSFNSNQTPQFLLNTFHSTTLFMTITCPDLLCE